MTRTDTRIPSLDGLRAVSILLVILGHSVDHFGRWGMRVRPFMAADAQIGVTVFFVISGYLITRLLLDELQAAGDISLRSFYARRAFRILPAFYAFLASLLVLRAVGLIPLDLTDTLHAALFIYNYAPIHASASSAISNAWVAHTWSLSVEEQFYILWPATLVLLGPSRAKRLALVLILAAPFIRVASYLLLPAMRGRMLVMLHTRMDSLMFGCLLALTTQPHVLTEWARAIERRRIQWIAGGFILVLAPLLAAVMNSYYIITVGGTLEGAAIAVLLVWVVGAPRSGVGRALNSRTFVHVGVLSYSLYLWQQIFMVPQHPLLGKAPFLLTLLAIPILAELSHHVVEQPFLRLRRRLARSPARLSASVVPVLPEGAPDAVTAPQ